MTEDEAWSRLLDLPVGGAAGAVEGPMSPAIEAAPMSPGTQGPPMSPEACALLDLYGPLRARAELVIGQLGQSLDGRIATATGHSHYINGPDDIRRLHRLRALVDAVVVGAGTVAADDPRLTVREVPGDNPVRVVLDPSGRLAPTARVFSDGIAPTLWLRSAQRAPGGGVGAGGVGAGGVGLGVGVGLAVGAGSPLPSSVEVVRLEECPAGGFEPATVVAFLAERGLRRVLVEGGGVTVSRFVEAGALDRLHISVAPLLIGSGRAGVTLPPIASLDEALRPPVRHFRLGDDLLFDLDLSGRARS